ncbi:MAG TPA: cytochrome P450 [Alphaproteobacteria bacterium]|nr:cytochrome P450 [Alphaproteobacteria bacterium]
MIPSTKAAISGLARAWRIRKNSLAVWSDDAFRADFIETRMLFRRVLVVNAPQAVKHVLLDRADNYVKSFIARQLLKPLGRGLLTSEGDTWRRQRRTMAPAFHPRRLEGFAPAMVESTLDMLQTWRSADDGAARDIAEEMPRLTLDIITRTMFSSDIRARVDEVRNAVRDYQRVGGRPAFFDLLGLPRWLPRPQARRIAGATAALDGIIYAILEERRRERAPRDDLLGLLLAARDEETGAGMDDRELRDQIATIFTAGHETTANALAWTWYLVALHPAVEEKLQAELREVLGGRAPAYGDLPRLGYTRMVIEEALRLYPPAHTMSREALADDEIAGHPVPKGSTVLISPWLIHRHEKLWERPLVFDPERMAPARLARQSRYAYIPFGGGPRICIGAGFALQEATLIVAAIAQEFRLTLLPGQQVEPLGLITLRPKGGLPMRLFRR